MEGNNKQATLVQIEVARPSPDASRAPAQPPEYWRSLEELAQTPEFQERLHREFPHAAAEWHDDVSRRGFLKLMSASLAMAGLTGCTKIPVQSIVPYVRQPEEITLGVPLFFATAMDLGGYGVPLLARSNEGRPTKIEGNPEHPATLGGTDLYSQASVLELYQPDRSQTSLYQGEVRPWVDFVGAMQGPLNTQKAMHGSGLRLLTQSVSSPTLAAQIRTLQQTFPEMKWHQWEPLHRDYVRAGAIMAFGEHVETHYLLHNADVIVSLDADFLYPGFPAFHLYARQWASRRDPDHPQGMTRMYAIESTPTTTGFKADHRLRARPSDLEHYARVLASQLGISAGGSIPPEHQQWIAEVARDLKRAQGRSVVIAGATAPPIVHALAHAMNETLGAVGRTVSYTDPVIANPVDNTASLKELVSDINAGKVHILIMLGGNPAFDCPADLDFAGILPKVPLRVRHGMYADETSLASDWHVNATHYLEEWSDLRAANGMVSIVQPLIAPLYGGHSAHEVLSVFNGQPDVTGYDLVRTYWKTQYHGADFEGWWRKSVHDGFIEGTAFPPRTVRVRMRDFSLPPAPARVQGIEVIFRQDPNVYDGRFANNGWLQETPKPGSKLAWDNPAYVSPATAKRLGLNGSQNADVVEIEHRGRKLAVPVWIQPGHADDCLTLFLGGGRTRSGETGTAKGVNTYQLRFADEPYVAAGVQVRPAGQHYMLASRQGYQDIQGRNLVRFATLDEYKQNPHFAHERTEAPPRDESLYPEYSYPGYAWGMAIDLNRCIGCNACVVACQSENNVPIVGKDQVIMGRQMQWLRIDQYYHGSPANPRSYFEPMLCVHCEKAPCELVCPVNATVHSSEGINDMVYNRCVGTRYCSNNCPWKVRRFNFLRYQDWTTPQLKLMRNPEVTVRSRGVMEKCTFCVQRITKARIASEREDRRLRDGEVLTACQQACPSSAIIFGDINDRNAAVRKLKELPRNFSVLEELNTRPRTSWLAEVFNPNPAMPAAEKQAESLY